MIIPVEAKVRKETKHVLQCIECGGDVGSYDHLKRSFPTNFGYWSCSKCGLEHRFKGMVHSELNYIRVSDGKGYYTQVYSVEVIDTRPATTTRGLALLKFCDPKVSLYLVVDTLFFQNEETAEFDLDNSFYFNTHTCPTNYLDVKLIQYKGDSDPHGVFQFVKGATYDQICKTLGVSKETLLDRNNRYIEEYFSLTENVISEDLEDKTLKELKELASKATPGPWWIDSHGVNLISQETHETVFSLPCDPSTAVRHKETGNLSNWRNDWDASYIATANPTVIQKLIDRLENAENAVARLMAEKSHTEYRLNEMKENIVNSVNQKGTK